MSMMLQRQLDKFVWNCFDDDAQYEILRWVLTQATSVPLIDRPVAFDKFLHIKDEDPSDYLREIEQNDDWLFWTKRQQIEAQKETQTIPLVRQSHLDINTTFVQDVEKSELFDKYPKLTSFLLDFSKNEGRGHLARAMIVRLAPGKQVYTHIDKGLYYLLRDRYHFVLDSEGSRMKVHEDEIIWQAGQVHWFNNQLRHEAFNDGDKWRIHVIFDVLPYRNVELSRMLRKLYYTKNKLLTEVVENYKFDIMAA